MDPPTELPLHGTHEELALDKINWLPGEERSEKEIGGEITETKWEKKKTKPISKDGQETTGGRRKKMILTERW